MNCDAGQGRRPARGSRELDDLTGLPNRRAFRETFEREWRQAIRSGAPLSLLYIDADFFRNFNDRYGHGRGDEVLGAIAGSLEASIRRPRDVAARHGGEDSPSSCRKRTCRVL